MKDKKNIGLIAGTSIAVLLVVLPVVHNPTKRLVETWMARAKFFWWFASTSSSEKEPRMKDGHRPVVVVSELWIYPVKSLRRFFVPTAKVDALGLVGDRRAMLVVPATPPSIGFLPSDPTYKFLTQLQCPILTTIAAEILDGDILKLTCGDHHSIIVNNYSTSSPLLVQEGRVASYKARIWSDVVQVHDMGDEVAAFLQTIITSEEGQGVRLVTMAGTRPTDDTYIPPIARTWTGATPLTSFNSGYPVLVAWEASLDEVNRRLRAKGKTTIPMSNFRANIIISGTIPFEEDHWKIIQIGDTILHLVKGCPRCKQSCTDQETGEMSEEPVATMGEFRSFETSKHPRDVYFAQNAVAFGTSVSVGAAVKVIQRGDPVWEL